MKLALAPAIDPGDPGHDRLGTWVRHIALLSGLLSSALSADAGITGITWNRAGAHLLVEEATYGRMKRLSDQVVLCSFEKADASWVMRSDDNGAAWSAPVRAGVNPDGTAANPELCVLRSGTVLLFWNDRPRAPGGDAHFSIRMSRSHDGGRTWEPDADPVFKAGTQPHQACWEPAAVEIPGSELHLFFAHELPGPQEIAGMTSADEGRTWSPARQVSLRAGRRDGMPVPALRRDGRVVLSIEGNGVAGQLLPHPPFRPVIIEPQDQNAVTAASPHRWLALAEPPPVLRNVAAPYLISLPEGGTLLSVQSNEDEPRWHRMAVYTGDDSAKNFRNRSLPFGLTPDTNAEWNSLFLKDAQIVVALSHTSIDGRRGLWCVQGRLEREDSPPSPH